MQFGKKSIDFYDTTTNDLIQTLIQQTRYKYYLMGRSKKMVFTIMSYVYKQ
jgi:tetrahydromethanopterin S-methyltransferase subunit F